MNNFNDFTFTNFLQHVQLYGAVPVVDSNRLADGGYFPPLPNSNSVPVNVVGHQQIPKKNLPTPRGSQQRNPGLVVQDTGR